MIFSDPDPDGIRIQLGTRYRIVKITGPYPDPNDRKKEKLCVSFLKNNVKFIYFFLFSKDMGICIYD